MARGIKDINQRIRKVGFEMVRHDMLQRFTAWLDSVPVSETDAEYAASRVRELPAEQTRGFPFWFVLRMVHPSAGGPVVRSKEKMSALLARWNSIRVILQ
jgi:hypothetical protein